MAANALDGPDPDRALRALADPGRRAILAAVREEPRPVGRIAEGLGISQQAASHHLRILREAGLVRGTRSGTRHLFVVETDGLAAVRDYLDGFWPRRLRALKLAVEAAAASPEQTGPGRHGPEGRGRSDRERNGRSGGDDS
ncbi:MAG: metalloregulator ArsR/SmtB family transcription factor [Pseudoclavibacter sp.]|nr:metalloregulator ArsR/SmtB family transcription factor [Pseudoclavibacter sp.]